LAAIYSQIYIQVILAVEGRANHIERTWENGLYKYIEGFVSNRNQKILAVNGTRDHIHLLLCISPTTALIDLVRDIQLASARFVNQNQWLANSKFVWQDGFGAFSYARSQLENVVKYIENQEQIHKKMTYQAEYLFLLEKFEIDYIEADLFTWIEKETDVE